MDLEKEEELRKEMLELLDNPPFGQQKKSIAKERKDTPVYSGVIKYFPDALKEIARASKIGNDQHLPGQPLHWDRTKSSDDLDAMVRHLLDHGVNPMDDDGILHLTKVAWRALASLQVYLDKNN
tara:strand:+ start:589 stop:960 length:372 start_codon:yes stop_codon:yes gene_type:complete